LLRAGACDFARRREKSSRCIIGAHAPTIAPPAGVAHQTPKYPRMISQPVDPIAFDFG